MPASPLFGSLKKPVIPPMSPMKNKATKLYAVPASPSKITDKSNTPSKTNSSLTAVPSKIVLIREKSPNKAVSPRRKKKNKKNKTGIEKNDMASVM